MAKIKIKDLPKDMKISREEMKKVMGGMDAFTYGYSEGISEGSGYLGYGYGTGTDSGEGYLGKDTGPVKK